MSNARHSGTVSVVPSSDDSIAEIHRDGVGLIRSAVDPDEIDQARRTVLAHAELMRNTRPTASSRHLAGFHRFPGLEPLHRMITGNRRVSEMMTGLLGSDYRTSGLSDITINRSQPWHKDLLRGRFRHHLDGQDICARNHGTLLKVIVYLQDSNSLQFVPGSHRQDISLESDLFAIPPADIPVNRVEARVGDAVIVDVCTTHRGSAEEAFDSPRVLDQPKILVSTVFGKSNCDFVDRMELGNAERLAAWRCQAPS